MTANGCPKTTAIPSPIVNGLTERVVASPSGTALASFSRCAASFTVRKGQPIISAGQACSDVYLVSSGRVQRIGVGSDGREVVLDEYWPGEFFGIEGLIWTRSRLPAIAAERSVIRTMPTAAFERLMRHEPELAMIIARMLAARLARCHSLLYEFAHGCIRERVLAALNRLASDYGTTHQLGTIINHKINQGELARMVGASRTRVSLAIGQLIREGRLTRSEDSLVICGAPQTEALCALAGYKFTNKNGAATRPRSAASAAPGR